MNNHHLYIGKNVKHKNLRNGYKYFVVIGYSDTLGYKLLEKNTETTINVKTEVFCKQFKIIE
jgi:hypothetical protein